MSAQLSENDRAELCKACGKPQKLIGPRCECGEPDAPSSLAVATGWVASLEAEIEHYFRTATDEQIEALLKKANFDFYNRIGADVLPPREAPQNTVVRDGPLGGRSL